MNPRTIFILLFSILLFSKSNGQPLEKSRELADYYLKTGNYSLATKEYQRYLFFNPTTDAEILDNIGHCFFKLKQYGTASEFYEKAFFTYTADSLKLNALFNKIKCFILNGEFGMALSELYGISDTVKGEAYRKKEFYTGVAHFGLEDFENAQASFINSIDPENIANREKIKAIFSTKKRFARPNPNTALILSMCFPGLGQFYTGDIKNGVNSILLLSALAFLGIDIALNQTIWDGLITVGPWFQRYYQGGYTRAENMAKEKRLHRRYDAYEEIIQLVADSKK